MTYKRKEVIGDCSIFNFPRHACIYSIEKNGTIVYIGSTCHPIKNRIRTHISESKRGKLLPLYEWIRANNYCFDVVFIESVIEENREEREK